MKNFTDLIAWFFASDFLKRNNWGEIWLNFSWWWIMESLSERESGFGYKGTKGWDQKTLYNRGDFDKKLISSLRHWIKKWMNQSNCEGALQKSLIFTLFFSFGYHQGAVEQKNVKFDEVGPYVKMVMIEESTDSRL